MILTKNNIRAPIKKRKLQLFLNLELLVVYFDLLTSIMDVLY